MKMPKWLICKATKIWCLGEGGKYFRYGWRILGIFVEDGRRHWKDFDANRDQEVLIYRKYW